MSDIMYKNILEQVQLLMLNENFQRALVTSERLCEEEPRNAEAWMMQGVVQGKLWALPKASACLERALEIRPDYPEAQYHLGSVLRLQGKPENALRNLEQTLKLDPGHTAAWQLRGEILKQLGRHKEAAACYQHVLEMKPSSVKARLDLAKLEQLLGDLDAAERNYIEALRINPNQPDLHFNLGLLYQTQGRYEIALTEYQMALISKPGNTDTYVNMCCIFRRQNNHTGALNILKQALEYLPRNANLHFNYGVILIDMKQYKEAGNHFQTAIQIQPDYALAYVRLGDILRLSGNRSDAISNYRKSLEYTSEMHDYVDYMLAALGATDVPAVSPAEYIKDHFDSYSDHFEKHLVDELEYRTPDRLYKSVEQVMEPGSGKFEILDLGCGTGLCAALFKDIAANLVGVDLSSGMLKKAGEHGYYDELYESDINEFLQTHDHKYDLIMAADVFIYIGDLEEIFYLCKSALKPDGLFAFSIEAGNEDVSYMLTMSGRYTHSTKYINELMESFEYVKVTSENIVLRMENNRPVDGCVYVLSIADNRA